MFDKKALFVLLVLGVSILLISCGAYILRKKSISISFDSLPWNSKQLIEEELPIVTKPDFGSEETDESNIWLWLTIDSVRNENGVYHLIGKTSNGNLIKVFIGLKDKRLGAANSLTLETTPEFPSKYPEWKIVPAHQIENMAANSNYAIVKIRTEIPEGSGDCDDKCQQYLSELTRLIDNNVYIANSSFEDAFEIEVGPASQILFIDRQFTNTTNNNE